MKYVLFILAALLLIGAADINGPQLEIQVVAQTPNVISPGDDITLQIRVENKGGSAANQVNVSLDLPGGIELRRDDLSAVQDLCGGCVKEYTFYLRADAETSSGQYPIKINAQTSQGKYSKEAFLTFVGGANIILKEYTLNEVIDTNQPFTTELTLTNVGTGKAQTVKITSSSENLILLDRSAIIIPEIGVKSDAKVTARFSLSEKVTPDTHKFPLLIEFKNENGEAITQTIHMGIPVANKANLNIQNAQTTPKSIKQGDDIELLLRVENVGNGDAENVKVQFETVLDGSTTAYVGKLNSDEDAPAIIYLRANKIGKINSNITLSYTDDTGNHVTKEEFILTIKPNFLFLFVILLPILGVMILAYRRKKKISEFLYHKKVLQRTNKQLETANKNLYSGRARTNDLSPK